MAPAQASRAAIFRLMHATQHGACPCHGHLGVHPNPLNQLRRLATPVERPQKEYAFEVRCEAFVKDGAFLSTLLFQRSQLPICDLETG